MTMFTVRAFLMPYGLEKNADGTWIVFNRDYKPLGYLSRERVAYGDPKYALRIKGLGPAVLARLDVNEGRNKIPNRVYLYNDATVPEHSSANMKAYLDRLRILMRLQAESER